MRDPLLNQISQDELDQIKDLTFDIESIDSLQRNNQLYIYKYIYIYIYIYIYVGIYWVLSLILTLKIISTVISASLD